MKKSMVYFIMYIVLISELLIVILERDELHEQEMAVRDKMLTSIAESYKAKPILFIPAKKSDYNTESKEPLNVVLTPLGLVSDEEKNLVKFFVDVAPNSKAPAGWPSGGIKSNNGNENFKIQKSKDGSGTVVGKFNEGEYEFVTHFEVERQLPGYLPPHLLEALKQMVGEQQVAKSSVEKFSVSAKRQGGVKKKGAEIL